MPKIAILSKTYKLIRRSLIIYIKKLKITFIYLNITFNSPRSPTARVYVAAGGNIIRKSFLLMAKCRGDGREPSQRMQRAVVAVLWC